MIAQNLERTVCVECCKRRSVYEGNCSAKGCGFTSNHFAAEQSRPCRCAAKRISRMPRDGARLRLSKGANVPEIIWPKLLLVGRAGSIATATTMTCLTGFFVF